ncbi:UvrD-helicase domain-containing protein [Pontibacter sp. G13]|uniref:ATP-dependent helicase n=1 Tax=Pontibacter sp. G13 TaxID=3074898 RepID=UPI00288B218E|nr:UvrD-helicase domain-containing protein [Pontibacter sp. G13]WNJ21238.1 3'-5' exonuclease [Pontibacter sp. G13]
MLADARSEIRGREIATRGSRTPPDGGHSRPLTPPQAICTPDQAIAEVNFILPPHGKLSYLYPVDFLNELNEAQRQAVTSLGGPQIVLAGAGSGKTRVLTYRLAYILAQGMAAPEELLALTFTNKAAKEMKERIFKLIGAPGKSVVMGTFHSIFSRMLRAEAELLGYTSSYTIYDAEDAQKVVRFLIKSQHLDDKIYKPKVVAGAISMCKGKLISPQEYIDQAEDDFNRRIAKIYQLYEQKLFKSNSMDFDDLLLKPLLLFKQFPHVLEKYQKRFKYIMVDEYQDTNHVQYLLTKMLAAQHRNICVVGDDAQSIYSFRGANIQNILNFEKDYPEFGEYKLEQNYRSTSVIVNAANSVIANNKKQRKKNVFTENELGDKIKLIEAPTEQDEARQVVGLIREQKQMRSLFNKDFAILYRTNSQSRALEDELRRANIPSRVVGGISFYQRKEIKDMVAYFKLAINPVDEQALLRVINYPTRGIGNTTIQKLQVYASEQGLTLWEAIDQVMGSGIAKRSANLVKQFATMIKSFGAVSKQGDAYESANYIAKHSGVLKELHLEIADGNSRWENVQELLNAARAFTEDPDNDDVSLESFLADISLFTSADEEEENPDKVTLMTVHSSKGLEFKSVFLVGLEENLFPSGMSMDSRDDLEEERRLFYVAVTRAEKLLTITFAKSRYRFGNLQFNEPSRFLDELDQQFVEKSQDRGRRETRKITEPIADRRSVVQPKPKLRPVRRTSPVKQSLPEDFTPADAHEIMVGMTVRHARFGQGLVEHVEGELANRKARVNFEDAGVKVLLLKFAKLEIVQA